MEISRLRLLTKISNLYYVDGLNQKEITEKLHISRPQISRMLSEARQIGLVKIIVENPFSEESAVSDYLVKKFGIKDALVIDTNKEKNILSHVQLEQAAADYFETILNDGDIIAVSPGKTVYGVANRMSHHNYKGCVVVPVSGSWGNGGDNGQANISATNIAAKLSGKSLIINAPSIVSSAMIKEALFKEPGIKEVFEVAQKATVALFGVGQLNRESTIFQSGVISQDVLDELIRNGACASFCSSFLNNEGEEVNVSITKNLIGLSLEEISCIPNKILVAGGSEKSMAIKAMLTGKRIDYLVTDLEAVKKII